MGPDQFPSNDRKAVILTAIPEEYTAVRAHLSDVKEVVHPQQTVYESGTFTAEDGSRWEVGIVETGAGGEMAAVETERAISFFKPDVVFFVGVAGGLKDVELCDVVAATVAFGYEYGKVNQAFEPRPNAGESSYSLTQRAKAEAKKEGWLQRLSLSSYERPPKVFVAPIAAGSKVIAARRSDLCRFLRANYGHALAVDMESQAVLKAAHANEDVRVLIVRGISDLITGKAETDRAGFQKLAAEAASAFAFEVLARLKDTDTKEVGQYVLESSATLENIDVEQALAIQAHLRDIAKDMELTLKRMEQGSVRLVVEGSLDGYRRLKDLLKSGMLSSKLGIEIIDIRWIGRPSRKLRIGTTQSPSPIAEVMQNRKYAGNYVAFRGFGDFTIVSSGPSFTDVFKQAQKAGIEMPVVCFVPEHPVQL